MTPLIDLAELVLTRAGYSCWRSEGSAIPSLGFEDSSLLGFVFAFPDAKAIIEGWRRSEQIMIAKHAIEFRRAGEKAWNVYCAFLTRADANRAECRQLRVIEEDLEQTRKLTGTSQIDEAAVSQALLPILPISSKPQLGSFDADARLARRLDTLVPGISGLLLDDSIEPVRVVQHLSQSQ
jgi:hypothetical protein